MIYLKFRFFAFQLTLSCFPKTPPDFSERAFTELLHDANGPIQFQGDLSFLNTLQQFIPSDGFQDPPSLDVTADGITAGYTLPIPSIGVGVFSVENNVYFLLSMSMLN